MNEEKKKNGFKCTLMCINTKEKNNHQREHFGMNYKIILNHCQKQYQTETAIEAVY